MRHVLLVAALVLLAGCTASPEDPEDGEMTGVVISTNDACCWPPGGGVAESSQYEVVALLPPDEFVRRWEAQHPDDSRGSITPDDWWTSSAQIKVPVDVFSEGADPGDEPLYATIVDGRWRVPYDGDPVMVCVGRQNYDYEWAYSDSGYGYSKRLGDEEYLFVSCGLVDEPTPVAVTVSIHFGGIGVSVASRADADRL